MKLLNFFRQSEAGNVAASFAFASAILARTKARAAAVAASLPKHRVGIAAAVAGAIQISSSLRSTVHRLTAAHS